MEDSATAEISRSQVWQWLRHGAKLEENGQQVTKSLVNRLATEFVKSCDSKDRLLTVAHAVSVGRVGNIADKSVLDTVARSTLWNGNGND